MPIVKFANGKQNSVKQLKHLIKYITNPAKTRPDLIYGHGLFKGTAYENIMLTKQLANQNGGRQYIHWITSFDPKDNISPELAHELGKEFAKGFNDFQWLLATHTDRQHVHNHFILNSVNFKNGLKFSQSPGDLEKLKRNVNEIYHNALLFDSGTGVQEREEDFMWYEEDYDENDYEILPKAKSDDTEIEGLRRDIQNLTASVTAMAQCMSGVLQICNPQTLSNAISNEIDRQLNQKLSGYLSSDNKNDFRR